MQKEVEWSDEDMLPLPIPKFNKKSVRVLTEQGESLIDIEKIYRVNDKLCLDGKLMGHLPTKVYLSARDFYRMLVLLVKPNSLSFVLLSSYYLLRGRVRNVSVRRK